MLHAKDSVIFLIKVPEELPQFNITEDDFEMIDRKLIGAPCNKIQSIMESKNMTHLENMYQKYFRCGFKATFSGALRRVFSGMNAIQHYEVTMMREYTSDGHLSFCLEKDDSCFIAEFSLQSKC